MKISENFKLEEFNCKDGTIVPTQYFNNLNRLVGQLEVIREAVNSPIIVTSGYRTKDYNKKVGGVVNSQHLTASAADFYFSKEKLEIGYAIIVALMRIGAITPGGLRKYKSFIHYDIRGKATFF